MIPYSICSSLSKATTVAIVQLNLLATVGICRSLGLLREEIAPLLLRPRAGDLIGNYSIPTHRGRHMNPILPRKPDSVLEIFRNGYPAVRAAFEFEEFLKVIDLIGDDLGREDGQFLADLEGSECGGGDVEIVALILEEQQGETPEILR